MARQISPDSPAEYVATFTTKQLRTIAASTRPEHIALGFAAQCELILRGEA